MNESKDELIASSDLIQTWRVTRSCFASGAVFEFKIFVHSLHCLEIEPHANLSLPNQPASCPF